MQELLIVLKAMEPGNLVYMQLGAFDEICITLVDEFLRFEAWTWRRAVFHS